jgi:hypothetical protein
MSTFFVIFGYTWRVLRNCIEIAVVLVVFLSLRDRFEFIVISILGLIYACIRTIAFGQVLFWMELAKGMDKRFLRLECPLNDPSFQERSAALIEDRKMIDIKLMKVYIDGIFISITSLICLFNLFTHL